MAQLVADLRRIDLRLQAFDRDEAIRARFLEQTPFSSLEALERQITEHRADLDRVRQRRAQLAVTSRDVPGVEESRQTLFTVRARRAELSDQLGRLDGQIKDLTDLRRQLVSQSGRLTRAVVADEWLVDFDFVVCPRCGNEVDAGRTTDDLCYLCLQEPKPAQSREQLLAEQDRIVSQIKETDDVVESRRGSRQLVADELSRLDDLAVRLASELDELTAAFVSDNAARLERNAADQARIEAELASLSEYLNLLRRHEDQARNRNGLEEERDALAQAIERRELGQVDAEKNVRALEQRMLEYLRELHIPQLGDELVVRINRATYLPEIAGRSFDELSSQGLKTLVNIAHALAHHTVAIDRRLPLPGLLILDGLSANAGFEGFDQARVNDVYRLLRIVGQEYAGDLQLVAVDNELARNILLDMTDLIVLTLSQDARLIRPRGGQ
jgi:DNA repair exonuclease SbcCD ATPase subunit